jgi:hypothetical protein
MLAMFICSFGIFFGHFFILIITKYFIIQTGGATLEILKDADVEFNTISPVDLLTNASWVQRFCTFTSTVCLINPLESGALSEYSTDCLLKISHDWNQHSPDGAGHIPICVSASCNSTLYVFNADGLSISNLMP